MGKRFLCLDGETGPSYRAAAEAPFNDHGQLP